MRSAHLWLVAFAIAVAVSRPAAADDRQECAKGSRETAAATIAACTRAIQSGDYNDRDLSILYHQRGYAWSVTGFADRVERAFNDYSEAIRLDPKIVGSLLNRSHIYNQRHDYDRAIADADQAFDAGLSDYGKRVAYGERGYAYQAKGDNDRAIADYTDGIQLDPTNKVALTARGNAYLAKADPDRAIADYDRVIALDPKYAIAYYNRSLASRAKGELDRVIADCSEAIALYPNYRDAYFNRAYAYQTKGDLDRAIADYDRMIALDPNDRDAYASRAGAYLSKGDYRRFIADFDQRQALTWLGIIVALAVAIWLCWRAVRLAGGRWPGQTMMEICERQVVELQRKNVVLERIAVALEKHSA
ncbi:MAG: hypothetical protein V7632_3279 [Bradyrhizobium sp.]|jgi:tetratricopeptide (TPR) repeat protein